MRRVGDDVFVGTGTAVNWLLVRDGDAFTLVDTGWPGDRRDLERGVRSLGLHPAAAVAVLLTHSHIDHSGSARYLHQTYGVPVLTHADEVPLVRGERTEQAGVLDVARRAWRPSVLRWSTAVARVGALSHPCVPQARPWKGTDALDVPGRPVPVPCAGHTSGHSAYHFPGAGVLATGDALVTGHPLSSLRGPQLLPDLFATDPDRAVASLEAVADVEADLLVPGHGDPWSGSPRTAAERALGRR